MNRKTSWISYYLVPLILLGLVAAGRVVFFDKMEAFSLRVFDYYQTLKPRVYQNTPVRFIDIDDESLSKVGQWPWPRTVVSQLITKLAEKGAAVVVLDIVFAEPDRTSPANILPLWSSNLEELNSLKAKVGALEDHDQLLARTLSEHRTVTGFTLSPKENGKTPLVKSGFAHIGDDPLSFLPVFHGAVSNLPEFEKASSGNGSFNFIADPDGVLRRVPLVFRFKDQLIPGLTAEALRAAQGASSYVIKTSGASGESGFGERTGFISVKIGKSVVPTDSKGRMWLYDTGRVAARYVPAWKVLEDQTEPVQIEGNIVFIGSSASGLKDLRATPLSPVAAGTEIHVQLAEQMLTQEFLNRPDWALGAEMVFVVFLGMLLIFLLPRLGALPCAFISAAAAAGAFGYSWHAFTSAHWLFDPLTPSLAVLILYLAVSLMNFLRAESERKQIRGAFAHYVSPFLLDRLSKHPEELKLGGESRPMTVLFADIRNFTTLSEKLSAEELTSFMNQYLTPMTDVILKARGTIDKYIGDCIMAFWNAPVSDPDHASNACRAALEMQARLQLWNESKKEEAMKSGKFFEPVQIGIGLNTGECCVGNLGSQQRFDYSVLGDNVNLASRLENESKFYGTGIVTGEKTYLAAPDFASLEIDWVRVKGKTIPVKVYALLGDSTLKNNPEFKKLESLHAKLLTAYRDQKWNEVIDLTGLLREAGKHLPLKKLYGIYQERALFYKQNSQPNWDSVNSLNRRL